MEWNGINESNASLIGVCFKRRSLVLLLVMLTSWIKRVGRKR